jgi:GNAT superfamily N-acetyltransferase
MLASDANLSRRLERVAAEHLAARFGGPGNPLQSQFLRRGSLLATKVPFAPRNPRFNQVHGLEDPDDLGAVLEFYAATSQCCWINVAPYCSAELTRALAHAGFLPQTWASMLCAAPVPAPPTALLAPPTAAVDVGRIVPGELDRFLDTLNVGFDVPTAQLDGARRNQSFWCDVPDWHLYLARVNGEPAGAAVLAVHDDIGYLAAGAVLPAFRHRGVHAALIAARVATARELGLRMLAGQADYGSQSQRNQQRAGLAIVHTKTIWSNASAA